jgi:hypothetical protein
MRAKCFEVRDRMTFIPVLAVEIVAMNEGQLYLLRRAGFFMPFGNTIGVINLQRAEVGWHPHGWGDSRTMREAHAFIEQNFSELDDGAVVDVEFIRGETTQIKRSERYSED